MLLKQFLKITQVVGIPPTIYLYHKTLRYVII